MEETLLVPATVLMAAWGAAFSFRPSFRLDFLRSLASGPPVSPLSPFRSIASNGSVKVAVVVDNRLGVLRTGNEVVIDETELSAACGR